MPGEFDMAAAVADVGAGLGFSDDNSGGGDAGGDLGTGDEGGDGTAGGWAPDTGAAGGTDAGGDGGTGDGGGTPDDGGDGGQPAASAGKPSIPAPGPDDPPRTWKPEVAAKWATIDPVVKAEIQRREQEMFTGLETYKADANFGKSFKGVLDPYMPILNHYRIDPVQQVRGLMEAHYTLATGKPEQKAALFQKLARDYGVDLKAIGGVEDPNAAPYTDPAVKTLTERLEGVESRLSAEDQQRLREKQETNRAEVAKFASDPANPYFEEVADDIAALFKAGVVKSLAEAYEKAVWANPVTRAKEQARQTAAARAKEEKEAKERAEKARKATAANVRTTAKSGSAAAPLGSMDDTLNEALAAIRARG